LLVTSHDPTNSKWGFHDFGWEKLWIVPAKEVHEENGFDPSFLQCLMAAKREIERQKVTHSF